jgi:hypothetical protein
MPASLYSTGILFPKDKSQSAEVGMVLDANEGEEVTEDDNETVEELKNNAENADSKDTLELNQMYPQSMGLTFSMNGNFLKEKELSFNIGARYYRKLKKDDLQNIAILCEVSYKSFVQFLTNNYLTKFFSIIDFGVNKCLKANHKFSTDEVKEINQALKTIDQNSASEIFEKDVKALLNSTLHFVPKNLSSLIQTIFSELKNKTDNVEKREKLYKASQKVELLENYKSHIKDLVNLFSRDTIWMSENLKAKIKITGVKFESNKTKKTYLANRSMASDEKVEVVRNDKTISDSLQHIFKIPLDLDGKEYASLSANIQLSRDTRYSNEKVFVKIQFINDSTPFKKDPDGKRYYSVATEKVNNKAFFGVKVALKNKNIVPYTNYIYKKDKDGKYDEDTTTKFIYNQFEDYAIGHGCSVNWGRKEQGVFVETEYLPNCETFDIEPVPRDKNRAPIKLNYKEITSPPLLENSKSQEFKWLSIFSEASNQDVIVGLLEFVESYGSWIKQKREHPKYQFEYKDIAGQELDKCQQDYQRMKSNIDSLLNEENNAENLKSFRLMNAAMFMQLFHSENVKNGEVVKLMVQESFNQFDFEFYKKADDRLFPPFNKSAGWRAFQLAFILLNLDGIFKTQNDDKWIARNEWVDLVWFPTGGGKTEAYLGLIALTIINRRNLYKESGGGVAAIMRYTLRLLTMQQFQRATIVIMALELLRRWDEYELGKEPITIGLWVGDNSLPNSMKGLIEQFKDLKNGKINKIPFTSCPWCGSKLRPIPTGSIVTDNTDIFNLGKAHLYCDNSNCSFTEPDFFANDTIKGFIPVNLCDESIYQQPPTLLFGTVDKFAQLAHKVDGLNKTKDSRRLFGRGNWESGKPLDGYLPPDLIIQDELHLLLGPLGSSVALFESAVDQLCTRRDGTRPKIISSTATTRNTQLQIAAIFGREVNLFPKPGVECDDSFFAFYKRKFESLESRSPKYIAKRKYVGVLPTGRTQIWMQMRLAAILMTHRVIFELKELGDNHPINFEKYDKEFIKAMDYYHTTISYFNSLKEVGKTQSQVQTYILKELRRVFNRVLRPQKLMHAVNTYGPIEEAELTGRLSGEEVKNELKNVESKWKPENRFAHIEQNNIIRGNVPPEFVVATNMISVGIDVSRFNTIIMNSMPRNTAEYIQASSRVARDSYGLVLTVHHPFRARDISHYEKFIEFHEKMYTYVEPISITPFTKKAIERYLGLYLATMIRHTRNEFTNRNTASVISQMSDEDLRGIVNDLLQYFKSKKSKLDNFDSLIQNLLKDENINQIKVWLEEALEEWKILERSLDEQTDLVFSRATNRANQQRRQEQLYVDIEAYEGNIHSKKWQVPMSLRVIEPEAAIKINLI